jgi:hypothetical protein
MEIYLINNETNEVTQTYQNVEIWGYNFVEYRNNGMRGKIYCDTNIEHFSDKMPEIVEVSDANN